MSKEKKIGVSKIVIQIGDKEVSLTIEQVKELSAALSSLLGSEKIIERWYPRYWYADGGTTVYGNTTVGVTTNTDDANGICYTLAFNDGGDSYDCPPPSVS
jgi:hypothetical protein